jgi:hypothetical protein
MTPLFGRTKSLTELEEDDDRLDTELSIAQKRAAIRRLEEQSGQGSWKAFSSNGKKGGIDWGAVGRWLRTH